MFVSEDNEQIGITNGSKIGTFDARRLDLTDVTIEGAIDNDKRSRRILCCNFSCNGQYLAACDEDKHLYLWQLDNDKSWRMVSVRHVAKRPTCLVITRDCQDILVADKAGFVTRFSINHYDSEGDICLGHISIILCMAISPNNQYLVTGDRDEKIRISHYPHTYNIASFCLGHIEFVSALVIIDNETMISGSGDGTLKVWKYPIEKLLISVDVASFLRQSCSAAIAEKDCNQVIISHICFCSNLSVVAVSCENIKVIVLYKIVKSGEDLQFLEIVKCNQPPLGLAFIDKSLWVLMPNSKSPIDIWNLTKGFNEKISIEVDSSKLTSLVAMNGEFFQGIGNSAEPYLSQLKRKRIDYSSDFAKKQK